MTTQTLAAPPAHRTVTTGFLAFRSPKAPAVPTRAAVRQDRPARRLPPLPGALQWVPATMLPPATLGQGLEALSEELGVSMVELAGRLADGRGVADLLG